MNGRNAVLAFRPHALLGALLFVLAGCSTVNSSVRPPDEAPVTPPDEKKGIVELAMTEYGADGSASEKERDPETVVGAFAEAERIYEDGEHGSAAKKFLALADRAPDHDLGSAALYNAASALELHEDFERAVELYERFRREYPDSRLVARATYRLGVEAERFFDYDEAIDHYYEFAERAQGTSPRLLRRMGFLYAEKRPRAMVSTAVLAEALQRYREAARRYERFVGNYPDHEEAAGAQSQAAEMWEEVGDADKTVAAFREYVDEFGGESGRTERVLEGLVRVGDIEADRENWEAAQEAYRRVVDRFEALELEPGSKAAYYPARARFQLAEFELSEWQCIRLEGSLSEQKNLLDRKIEGQKKLAEAYKEVWEYKNLEYTLAAAIRIGNLYDEMARDLDEAAIPFEEGTEKYETYDTKLEEIAAPLHGKAIERYEKVYERAREEVVSNEWTRLAYLNLNHHAPEEYPENRMPKVATSWELSVDHPEGDAPPWKTALRSGDHERAIAEARERLRDAPGDVDLLVTLARANFRAGRYTFVEEVLERVTEQAPKRAEAYYLFGAIAAEDGDDDRAAANFEKALEYRPDFPEAHAGLGRLYFRSGDYGGAAKQFEEALEARPDFPRARMNLGNAYKRMGRYKRALEQYQKLMDRDEAFPSVHFNLGIVYLEADLPDMDDSQRLDEAVEQFEAYEGMVDGDLEKQQAAQLLEQAREERGSASR